MAARAIDGRGVLAEVYEGNGNLVLGVLNAELVLDEIGVLVLGCNGLGGVVFVLLFIHGRRGHGLLVLVLLGVWLDGCVVVGAGDDVLIVILKV